MDALSLALIVRTNERLAELSRNSFAVLSVLPEHQVREVAHGEYRLSVVVWHDVLESGEHRIVVQAGKSGRLASWRFHADGFAITAKGQRRSLTDEELSAFH